MSNLWEWLTGGAKGAERRLTRRLYEDAKALQYRVPYSTGDQFPGFIIDFLCDLCEELQVTPSTSLVLLVEETLPDFYRYDRFYINLPTTWEDLELDQATMREASEARSVLKRHIRLVREQERLLPKFRMRLLALYAGIVRSLPLSAFSDLTEDGHLQDLGITFPEARLYDLCDDLRGVIDRCVATVFAQDMLELDLFTPMQERLALNSDRVSGIDPEKRHSTTKHRVRAADYREDSNEALVDAYTGGTPLASVLCGYLPFSVPFPARFEHTHILGGTGHGKTQLLQFLIASDLERASKDGRSIVVLDSQGDLIRTVSRLAMFGEYGSLSDRLVIIDPTDVEHPAALNMFDFNRRRADAATPRERELMLNAAIEAYEYFFGALLGAELTQRQGTMFRFLARLLMEIPGATIHTLRDLMENGERYRTYMEMLPHSARGFFETRFFDRSFSETKKQILARLWGVLSNASLERIFSHKESKIDLGSLTQAGKIILINTAKDFLGQEGANLIGRFMIAMLTQATLQRAALPSHERNPTFVYIDEAEDYIDENIGMLLTQARKYRVGLILAHQNLDQLPPELRSVVLANTTIKFAGGVSSKDAAVIDGDFRVNRSFLLSQRKEKHYSEFACFVRNETDHALSIRVPLGLLEAQDTLDRHEYESLIAQNRTDYTAAPEYPTYDRLKQPAPSRQRVVQSETSATSGETPIGIAPPEQIVHQRQSAPITLDESRPAPRRIAAPASPRGLPRGGGAKHRHLQELIKTLGEERGFRAQIEEATPDGKGRIDVVLARDNRRIACEISVTTCRDHELQNVEKCLAAGFEEVVLVAPDERHLRSLEIFVGGQISEQHRTRIRFLLPEALAAHLGDTAQAGTATKRIVVRGYNVKVTGPSCGEDAKLRKAAIAEVMVKSLGVG